jgi:hypothetical protein
MINGKSPTILTRHPENILLNINPDGLRLALVKNLQAGSRLRDDPLPGPE